MAEDDACKVSPWGWVSLCKGVAIVVAALGIAAPSVISAYFSRENNKIGGKVEAVQAENSVKTQEVKEALDARSDKVDKALGKIQATATKTESAVVDTMGIQLFNSWKYLQEVADYSKKPEDVKMAEEAKAAFDKYRSKK